MRIAVLGTGLMGAPIARNLARAGFAVSAWNRSRDKAATLADSGITIADTPRDAARYADVALVMVSTGDVAEDVIFGPEGAAAALPTGGVLLVMSSIPVDVAQAQAARARALGLAYVDAPVSGGETGAIAGSLVIMAGGEAAVIDRLASLFAPLGRVTRIGPVGTGQLAKLANQLIVGVTIGAVAEALLLAERGGADPVAVRAALIGGFADSTVLRQHGERMIERRFTPGAHATTQLKDLRTAVAQGTATRTPLPLTEQALALYAAMCDGPNAALDHSAVYLELALRAAAHPRDN